MPASPVQKLQNSLKDGLSIVSRIWDQPTKSWVTCICAEDVDNDGETEVVVCTREGRVYLLSAEGNVVWQRIIGAKAWVGTAIISKPPQPGQDAHIIVGTRDGKIYILDKQGRTISKDNEIFAFDHEGRALDPEEEQKAYWYSTGYAIRQVCTNPAGDEIIFASDDRYVYKIDRFTGELIWSYKTNGWVRAVFVGDITGDGKAEILIGSADKHLYLFDDQNQLLVKYSIGYQVQTLTAADIDQDNCQEVLVATNSKELVALTYVYDGQSHSFVQKWRRSFENRFYTLCITDLEGDGPVEILAGSEDKHIYILNGEGNIIWRHNHKNRIYSICPTDLDNDGLPEVLIGSEQERVRAMRIRLRTGVAPLIRKYYRQLERSDDPSAITMLRPDERALLQDVLGLEKRGPTSLKSALVQSMLGLETQEQVTFKHASEEIAAGKYEQALVTFLKLEQQKVEQVWYKEISGHIRSVCLRHTMNKQKREIIVVTSDGHIYAYNTNKRLIWQQHLEDQIIDVQTGFIDRHMYEEIIICSSSHHIYILGEQDRQKEIEDALMSSICVLAPSVQSPSEIIIGSEGKKLYIYRGNLGDAPSTTIETREAVRIVRAHPPSGENMPEIVAASMGRSTYAYTRSGKELWSYDTKDSIRALSMKDINSDGNVEVLIGSEDRNIHVVDNSGRLLWRYYLPHHARAIDAFDTYQDGKVEVFVGCADGNLYVFNRKGDLLWTYQASDRIQTIRVEDFDNNGNIEILLGTEESFEILRVLDQQQIQENIAQCWQVLCGQKSEQTVLQSMLENTNAHPSLQSFAVKKLVEQGRWAFDHIDLLTKLAKEGSIEVRQALARAMTLLYSLNPEKARAFLYQLSIDTEPEVRTAMIAAVIENLPVLMHYDWDYGFSYLQRAFENESTDRHTRRMMIRKLHQLLDTASERTDERYGGIFTLLLAAAHYKDSEWVRQEAARTLAHFLDQNQGRLIIYIHLLIVRNIQRPIWEQIEHAAKTPVVKR
ncbi:MAG TPA: PQQ-binding-like beta-propeller repeat protein, partial [Ktedonobacteraceae bacterium]|nr:PQQ-binding-like beta-propeller repeat protein [Ktedonobacteraceae bacterium]